MSGLTQKWADTFRSQYQPMGIEWLDELRVNAARQLDEHTLPGRRQEAWKYTPLNRLETMAPGILDANPTDDNADMVLTAENLLENADHVIDLFDGQFASWIGDRDQGLSVMTLREGLERHEQAIKELSKRVDITGPSASFGALNTAFFEQGIVIAVDDNASPGRIMLRWTFSGSHDAGMHNMRVFVLMGSGARLDITEQLIDNAEQPKALNVLYQLDLKPSANLHHLRFQQEPDATVLISSTQAFQADDSNYRYTGFDLGGGLVRHQMTAELNGPGAHASFAGAFVVDQERLVDNHVSVDHAAPDCSSEQFFRGVLGGKGRGVFNGRALIRPGSDGSSVRQSNANLLLSDLAEMDTKPELEIYADEVEASHGATVGQLDENAVFYLQTRGLSDAEARRILTAAFCRAVADRLDDSRLSERIGTLIDQVMPAQLSGGR